MSVPILPDDNVPQRIAKLLPSELIAAALVLQSAVTLTTWPESIIVYAGLLIALLSPLYFWFLLKTRNVLHIVYLVISYLLLFTAIASLQLFDVFPDQLMIVVAMSTYGTLIWVFLITPIVATLLGKNLVG